MLMQMHEMFKWILWNCTSFVFPETLHQLSYPRHHGYAFVAWRMCTDQDMTSSGHVDPAEVAYPSLPRCSLIGRE
jgi:hypothetical protein